MPIATCLHRFRPRLQSEHRKKPMPDGDIRDDACVQWRLQRNCAMSPRSFMLHIAALAAVVAMVGIAFCAAGYPLVLCFCAFQVSALAAAAWVHATHAID